MYLTQEDYKSRISVELLDIAIEDDTGILDYCSKIAEDSLSGYMGHLYDIAGELEKQGLSRNYRLLSWALSIAVYHVFLRLPDVDLPEKVKQDYDGCLNDLENIAKGKFTVNLPPRPDADPQGMGDGLRRIGSEPPRSHRI